MSKKKLRTLALSCLAGWALALFTFAARGQTPRPAAEAPRRLTPQERRGKAIYQQGVSAGGGAIVALAGAVEVPASTLSCAGCHGAQGQGKTEAGITAGSLTWDSLLNPEGHRHPNGRRHKAFDEASLRRAITSGVDASGNVLAPIMPRYRMSETDLVDLISYLGRIGTDSGQGLTSESVLVGALLPLSGRSAGAGRAAREVLDAYFSTVNRGGGIYRRRVELRVLDGEQGRGDPCSRVRQLADEEQVFAILGDYDAGCGQKVARLMGEAGIPYLDLSAGTGPAGPAPGRYLFHLLPDVQSRARALVTHAARERGSGRARLVILYPEGAAEPSLVAAVEEQGRKEGYAETLKAGYGRERAAAARSLKALGGGGAADVLLLTAGGDEWPAVVRDLTSAKSVAALLLADPLDPREVLDAVAPGAAVAIYMTGYAAAPGDLSRAPEEYREFSKKHGLGFSHPAQRLAAYAAAKTFTEGLRIAGRDLSQEQFVGALESLRDFDTGAALRVSFGPERHAGSGPVHILKVDAKRKVLTSVPGPGGAD
jgi:ABC-type branched-subunit amino acid transport system substrate-binding protein